MENEKQILKNEVSLSEETIFKLATKIVKISNSSKLLNETKDTFKVANKKDGQVYFKKTDKLIQDYLRLKNSSLLLEDLTLLDEEILNKKEKTIAFCRLMEKVFKKYLKQLEIENPDIMIRKKYEYVEDILLGNSSREKFIKKHSEFFKSSNRKTCNDNYKRLYNQVVIDLSRVIYGIDACINVN